MDENNLSGNKKIENENKKHNTNNNDNKNNNETNNGKNDDKERITKNDQNKKSDSKKPKNENVENNIDAKEVTKNIRVYSYNSRGFDEIKQKFCMELLNKDEEYFPVLCNQENFVLKGNAHIIKNAMIDYRDD